MRILAILLAAIASWTAVALPQPPEWLESGEMSSDGTTWRTFLQMRLKRVP